MLIKTHLNVVAIPQTSELLLAGSIPDIEADGAPRLEEINC